MCLFLSVCLCNICVHAWESRKRHWTSRNLSSPCEPPCGCSELSPGPLNPRLILPVPDLSFLLVLDLSPWSGVIHSYISLRISINATWKLLTDMPRGVWVLSGWQSILNKKEVVSENVSESMQAEHGTDSYHHCGLPGLRPAWGSGGSVAIEKPLYHKLCHCLTQRERRPWPVWLGWRKTCGS